MGEQTEVRRPGSAIGGIAGVAGVVAVLFVLFGPVVTVESGGPDGATTRSIVSGIDYLLGSPHALFELFAWPVLLGVISVVGAPAAGRGRRAWAWSAAAALAIVAVLGMASIGLLFAPAALLMVVAAVLLE